MFRRVSVLVLVAMLWPASAWAAYVTPTSRSTGFVVTAARWNQDVVDNMIAVRTAVLDSVVNETAATDMTITATGDEIIFADQIKLLGTTSDPTNEQDVSYDSTDGVIQAKYKIGRVTVGGMFGRFGAATSVTSTGDQAFSTATFTVPASTIQSETIIEWEIWGDYDTDASPATTDFWIKKGSTVIARSTGRAPAAGEANQGWVWGGSIRGNSTTDVEALGLVIINAASGGNVKFATSSNTAAVAISASQEALTWGCNMSGTTGDQFTMRGGWVRIH